MNYDNMPKSETTEQIRLFNWARTHMEYIPELKLLHHIPNEGKRKETTGKILKAAGLTSGVPDICLPVPKRGYSGLYIEMKYGKNKPSKSQLEFIELLNHYGYKTAICYSFEDAREIIRHYLARAEGFDLVNCEEAFKKWNLCDGVAEDVMPNSPCKNCECYKGKRGYSLDQSDIKTIR